MEIKLKATVTIPKETAETLGINEDTPFIAYYKNGKIYIESVDDTENTTVEENEECECSECPYFCPRCEKCTFFD